MRTTVVVTIPFEKLMADLGAADLLGSGTVPSDPHTDARAGESITAAQARRLACNANIIPAVSAETPRSSTSAAPDASSPPLSAEPS